MTYPTLNELADSELDSLLRLDSADLDALKPLRSDSCRLGFAILLLANRLLGYIPRSAAEIPVRSRL